MILKLEIVTPVPKDYPVKMIDQLGNISGLLNLDKVTEKVISRMMISDMRKQIDLSQYSNQHYLIKMIDKSFKLWTNILKWKVVLYWPHWWTGKKRFPKLGVESFVKNGVKTALIPLLISNFQERKIKFR